MRRRLMACTPCGSLCYTAVPWVCLLAELLLPWRGCLLAANSLQGRGDVCGALGRGFAHCACLARMQLCALFCKVAAVDMCTQTWLGAGLHGQQVASAAHGAAKILFAAKVQSLISFVRGFSVSVGSAAYPRAWLYEGVVAFGMMRVGREKCGSLLSYISLGCSE